MSSNIPIVIVDDAYENILDGIRDAQEDGVLNPDREVTAYASMTEALELLDRDEPFVLILDHNMEQARDSALAKELGVVTDADLFGYHLGAAIRREHPFGLAIPIVYLSAQFQSDQFLKLLRQEGPFLPNFWADKHDELLEKPVSDLVMALDNYFDLLIATMQNASSSVFMQGIDAPAPPLGVLVLEDPADEDCEQ